jgi:spermidine/putrescine transport system substrate-binding protein
MAQSNSKAHEVASRYVSRRDFVKIAGLSVAAAGMSPLLSACGQGTTPTPKIGGELHFLSWEGYDLRDCMQGWEKANGVSMTSTYIGDYPEIPAKLGAATPGMYDLITYYNGFAPLYINDLKIVSQLDVTQIPNIADLYPMFRTGRWWVDASGAHWGVPWTFGVEGCCYKADAIDPPGSWLDLLKPEFKNKIAIVDDNIGNYYIGGQILGFTKDIPNLSRKQLDQIIDLFKQFRKNARTMALYGDLAQLFASGEIVACIPGWGAVNVWSQQRGAKVEMNVPREGAFTFIEAYAIPKGSKNASTVNAWINEAISPEVQVCAAASLAGGVVNPKAVPLLQKAHPELAKLYDYAHLDDLFKIAPVFDLPTWKQEEGPTYSDWVTTWENFKASTS